MFCLAGSRLSTGILLHSTLTIQILFFKILIIFREPSILVNAIGVYICVDDSNKI